MSGDRPASAKRRGADPAVAARLAQDMRSLANLVAASPPEMVADDAVWSATQRLKQTLEWVTAAAIARHGRHCAEAD